MPSRNNTPRSRRKHAQKSKKTCRSLRRQVGDYWDCKYENNIHHQNIKYTENTKTKLIEAYIQTRRISNINAIKS